MLVALSLGLIFSLGNSIAFADTEYAYVKSGTASYSETLSQSGTYPYSYGQSASIYATSSSMRFNSISMLKGTGGAAWGMMWIVDSVKGTSTSINQFYCDDVDSTSSTWWGPWTASWKPSYNPYTETSIFGVGCTRAVTHTDAVLYVGPSSSSSTIDTATYDSGVQHTNVTTVKTKNEVKSVVTTEEKAQKEVAFKVKEPKVIPHGYNKVTYLAQVNNKKEVNTVLNKNNSDFDHIRIIQSDRVTQLSNVQETININGVNAEFSKFDRNGDILYELNMNQNGASTYIIAISKGSINKEDIIEVAKSLQ